MLRDDGFDLRRHDRLAAGADDVASPADVREAALVVDVGKIAGAVPTVDEGVARRRLVVEVAVEEHRVGDPQLAVLVDAHAARHRWKTAAPGLAIDVVVIELGNVARL